MGKNALLAGLALSVIGLGIFAIFGGGHAESAAPDSVLPSASPLAASKAKSESAMRLAEEPVLEREQVEGNYWSESSSTIQQQAQTKLADLDVFVLDELGAPVPGAKIVLHMPAGGMVTRWASSTGQFTLLAAPLGWLAATAPGYRVTRPTLRHPVSITESGRLEIVVGGSTAVNGTIRSNTRGVGQIRLFKGIPFEESGGRLAADSEDKGDDSSGYSEQLGDDEAASRKRLMRRLQGSTEPTPEELAARPETQRPSPIGPLVASLSNTTFPRSFLFSGLDPGEYQLVVISDSHLRRERNFTLTSGGAIVDIDISQGAQAIVQVRYESGEFPGRDEVKLVDSLDSEGRTAVSRTAALHKPGGIWMFTDLEPGTWFVQVSPDKFSMATSYPISLPTALPGSPVLDLVLEEPSKTKVNVKFVSNEVISSDVRDHIQVAVRQPGGEFMGIRGALAGTSEAPFTSLNVSVDLGLLFPGEYDLYFFPVPGYFTVDEFWEGAFEATKRRIQVPKGGEETTANVQVRWLRPVEPDDPRNPNYGTPVILSSPQKGW